MPLGQLHAKTRRRKTIVRNLTHQLEVEAGKNGTNTSISGVQAISQRKVQSWVDTLRQSRVKSWADDSDTPPSTGNPSVRNEFPVENPNFGHELDYI